MKSTLRTVFCALALPAATLASGGEIGRLFFTPEQRAQLDRDDAGKARSGGDNRGTLSITGIVQKHGGERTIWINGMPQLAGKSDELSPESASVTLPGQKKKIRVKVGQKVYVKPEASER